MLSKTTGLRNFLIISSQSIVISFRNAAENDVQILEICDSSSFKCIPTLIRVSMRYEGARFPLRLPGLNQVQSEVGWWVGLKRRGNSCAF